MIEFVGGSNFMDFVGPPYPKINTPIMKYIISSLYSQSTHKITDTSPLILEKLTV